MRSLFILFFTVLSLSAFTQEDRSIVKSYPAMASTAEFLGEIAPLRDTPPRTDFSTAEPGKLYEKRNYFSSNEARNPNPKPEHGDPLVKILSAADRNGGPEIFPGFNFEGLHDPSGIFPPDPNGDIGKNHYVQMVNSNGNSWFQVWDKETGNSVYGPALSGTIWSQLGVSSYGDCLIQYDHDAERWLMLELRSYPGSQVGNQFLMAISNDSDPTGGWKAYIIQTQGFPDYPKLYVWNNAYFITINELLNGNKCAGYALDRSAMIAGDNAIDIYRFVMPNFQGISFQPATGADWEGGPPPPAGSPGYIFRLYDDAWAGGQDHLESWEVYVDWNNIGMSHIDGPSLIYTQPFETRVCFGNPFSFDCIEQPGTSTKLTAQEDIIMHRAPYRNFGDHESVVLNHISDVSGIVGDGGDAEIRWYELRKSGGGDWQIYQQGLHAPDLQTNRFMGTISMDEAGNIGLGYSGCSSTLYPGLYLTGHRKGDPLGEMTLEEHTLAAGGASHTTSRWGDYSSMTVDPYDGRTFWFTGEYQPNSSVTWGTRIGSFKVQRDTYDIKPELLLAPVPSALLGDMEQVKVRITNGGLAPSENVTVSLIFENGFVVTDNITMPIDIGNSMVHTFSQTVSMPVPGKDYKFRVITHWTKDQFVRNDTLDEVVQKLTSNDAEMDGKYNLPGLVCGSSTDFALVLRNAAGIPMQSADINWRVNTQPWQVYNWTGNLAPGARDTIELHVDDLYDGLNVLRARTSLPNGIQDEKINNDSLTVKFYSNTDGTYLTAESVSDFGALHWELRTLTNSVLAKGEVSAQQPTAQICSDDNECYKVLLRAFSFNWAGHFILKDIFGNVLLEITEADGNDQVFTICTPPRQQIDFGALALEAPVSGPGLSNAEAITAVFRNFGLTDQSNVDVAYSLDGAAWKHEMLAGPFSPGETISHTFAGTEDLSVTGAAYDFSFSASVAGDENLSNDTSSALVLNSYLRELALLDINTSGACSDTAFAFINILVKNNGIGSQHTFDVTYALNGVLQPTIPDNILVADPGQSAEVPLYIPGLIFGTNTLTLAIENVDGDGQDEIPSNDNSNTTFEIDPGGQLVDIAFSPDDQPQESSWDITDSQENILFSGGPYIDPMGFYIDKACLAKDSCYTFRIHDTGGNGMDNGYASITIDGFAVLEFIGDPFTNEYSASFCTDEFCANLLLAANVTPASGAGLSDGQIEGMASGGTPPYSYVLNGGNAQQSPIFNNLASGNYELVCVDALGCTTEITLNLGTVGTVEPNSLRKLEVSPNPTIGIAHLQLSALGNEKSAICQVYNTQGKLVQSTRMFRWDDSLRGNIALDKFPSGAYYIRVMGLDRIYATRIVKK